MTIQELNEYRTHCLSSIEKAKAKGRQIAESFCPECYAIIENIVAPRSTWNNKKFDLITKGCYQCGNAHFLKIAEAYTESFKMDNEELSHLTKR